MKRLVALLTMLAVLHCAALTAYAHDVPRERSDCSIEISVRYDGEAVSGGTLTAIKVGYVDEENGNYYFSQEMTGIRLDNITSPEASKAQEEFYNNNKETYGFYTQTQPVADGEASFSDLDTGLYLIVQETAASGFSKLGAFLVTVPYLEDGEYQYNVTAAVKSELEREPMLSKPGPKPPADPSLPQTGQVNWPIPLMAASGLGLFVIGWVFCFGKKRDCDES